MVKETYQKPLADIHKDLRKKGKSSMARFVANNPDLIVTRYKKDFDRMVDYRQRAKDAGRAGNAAQAQRYTGYYARRMNAVESKLTMATGRAVVKKGAKKAPAS